MLRHIAAFVAAILSAAPLAAQADPVVASRAAYQEAVAAYKAHDLPAFLRSATEASRLRPTHGGALYALASAHALLADTAAALAALRRFAALGYTADLAVDSDFASLSSLPGFVELRRRLERNATPITAGRRAFTLPERDLLTEGIAYDSVTRAFLVGSVHRRKILRVDRKGAITEFVGPGGGGLWAPLGMRVDPARRALWVASAAVPQMTGYAPADSFRSGLFRFDLASGKLSGRFPVPDDAKPHALGDVIVTRAGDAYATDSRSPIIYRVRTGADSLEAFVASPLLLSAQGLALDADERTLYVADYARGILRVDLATREVTPVPASDDMLVLGTDGLYLVGGALIAIQNGVTPHRVARFTLDLAGKRIESVTVLERARSDYAEPTLGVVVGNELYYVANSQWEQFRDDGGIDAPAELQSPLVLRLRL
jgi:sugar lactone lactonase YvrE